ncbi:hypothetical protein C8Q74DRAFT_1451435 [Fomes fomentarius]|nr:hypothetical protein C8Q74DRAFT_1451435 [Fomes fomentarius]
MVATQAVLSLESSASRSETSLMPGGTSTQGFPIPRVRHLSLTSTERKTTKQSQTGSVNPEEDTYKTAVMSLFGNMVVSDLQTLFVLHNHRFGDVLSLSNIGTLTYPQLRELYLYGGWLDRSFLIMESKNVTELAPTLRLTHQHLTAPLNYSVDVKQRV